MSLGAASNGLLASGLRVERDGRLLLDVAELHAPTSACTVIAGDGDAGKTLLASALAGALPGARGTVHLAGAPLSGPPSARRRAGLAVVAGTPLRVRGITVAEALALARGGRMPRDGAAPARSAADAFALFPLLAARRSLRCDRLSGGEHQLLRIACAWMAAPRALVLDSPTTSLADAVAEAVVAVARAEAARGAAVLWLDQPAAPAPAAPSLRLAGGRLSAWVEWRRESPRGSA